MRRLRDNRILFNLYQLYKHTVYFPLLGIGWSVLFIALLMLLLLKKEVSASKIAVLWARYSGFITPMSVTVLGLENIKPGQSYVMVANHQSQYDIFVIYGWLPIDFKWVMKAELRKVPIIGPSCYRLGHIFIDRKNHEAAVGAINRAKEKIRDGVSIMFFPEGRRSEDGSLLDFKKGAYKFALDIGLPILPLSIIGTRDILPANSTALFPGKAALVIHKPIPIDGYNDGTVDRLIARSKEVIRNGLMKYGNA